MPALLAVAASEQSSYAVTATITDESGQPATPTALAWTLTDMHGAVVNGRQEVAVSPLASTVTILLSGDDLAVPDPANARRTLTLEGTYNSSLGSNLPLVSAVQFDIEDVPGAG